MRHAIALLLCTLLAAGAAAAEFDLKETAEKAFDSQGRLNEKGEAWLEKANLKLDSAPAFLKNFFGDDRLNITVEMGDGSTERFGAVTGEGQVKEAYRRFLENPTKVVEAEEETLQGIVDAENPVASFAAAFSRGEIRYRNAQEQSIIESGAAGIVNVFAALVGGVLTFFASLWGV